MRPSEQRSASLHVHVAVHSPVCWSCICWLWDLAWQAVLSDNRWALWKANLQLLSSQLCPATKRQGGWVVYVPASQRKSFPHWQFSWALMLSIYIATDKNHGLIFRSAPKCHWTKNGRVAAETLGPLTPQDPFHAPLTPTKLWLFYWVCSLPGVLESQPLDGRYDCEGRSEAGSLRYDI